MFQCPDQRAAFVEEVENEVWKGAILDAAKFGTGLLMRHDLDRVGQGTLDEAHRASLCPQREQQLMPIQRAVELIEGSADGPWWEIQFTNDRPKTDARGGDRWMSAEQVRDATEVFENFS